MARDPADMNLYVSSENGSVKVLYSDGSTSVAVPETNMTLPAIRPPQATNILVKPNVRYIFTVTLTTQSGIATTDITGKFDLQSDGWYNYNINYDDFSGSFSIDFIESGPSIQFDTPVVVTKISIKSSDGTVKDITSKLLNL